MTMMIVKYALVILVTAVGAKPQKPIVRIDSGLVEGLTMTSSVLRRTFSSFLSIPYAKPPLGNLRFRRPEPTKPWKGVFVADRKEIKCPQYDGPRVNDTEDCLVLNVYVPHLTGDRQDKLLPVMVIIHEGGFLFGTGTYAFYRPEKFMDKDVVLVSFNYRLGILGFLNTQDESSTGNYGMYDQVMVLQWVKKYIRNFGGDPKKVTIFGNSAGGASVVYHMLSPLSKGLFQGAISESGSPLTAGTFQSDPLKYGQGIARASNCTLSNSTQYLVKCLRTKSIDELHQATQSFVRYYKIYNVGPSVECCGNRRFLTKRPLDLMTQKRIHKVPFIVGTVKDEGTFLLPGIMNTKKYSGKKYFDEEFCPFVAYMLDMDMDQGVQNFCLEARKKYFDGYDIDNPAVFVARMILFCGDFALKAGISKTVELFSAAGIPTQTYEFTYSIEGDDKPGNYTNHGDEITLMLDRKWTSADVINNTSSDKKMGEFFIYVWTKFATKLYNSVNVSPPGMKSLQWPLYTKTRKYLEINLNPKVRTGLLCENMDFVINQFLLIKKI